MRKAIVIITITGVIIFVLAVGQYMFKNAKVSRDTTSSTKTQDLLKKPEEAKKIMESVAPLPQADFVKDGYLRLDQEDEETSNWQLLYEEPGRLALIVNLNFNNRSSCDYGKGDQIRSEKHFKDGMRVHIEGTKGGNNVTVINLKVLE